MVAREVQHFVVWPRPLAPRFPHRRPGARAGSAPRGATRRAHANGQSPAAKSTRCRARDRSGRPVARPGSKCFRPLLPPSPYCARCAAPCRTHARTSRRRAPPMHARPGRPPRRSSPRVAAPCTFAAKPDVGPSASAPEPGPSASASRSSFCARSSAAARGGGSRRGRRGQPRDRTFRHPSIQLSCKNLCNGCPQARSRQARHQPSIWLTCGTAPPNEDGCARVRGDRGVQRAPWAKW